jgi:AcrR family transcriptional regulator
VRPQRWQRRKEARAPEILEAALACFADKGFAATRMDDIAAHAGITKGTIYLYFESKEAVFKALARQEVGARLAAMTDMVDGFEGPTADLLRLVLSTMGGIVRTSDAVILPRLLLAEAGNFPELGEFWRREIIDRGLGLFERIIRRGIARGEFRNLAPQHAARLCVAPMLLVALWRTVFSKYDAEPYDYQGLIDSHIDTLLRGLAAEGTRP